VSAPEREGPVVCGVQLSSCPADIIEIAAFRGRTGDLERVALGRGVRLPPTGRAFFARDRLALCIRPQRWLLLTPPGESGAALAVWQGACAGIAAAIDLSSALAALHLVGGSEVRELLARGCRLDLDPEAFPVGCAAASPMVQVAAIIAALPAGFLLLTPSSTARHFREWLSSAGEPFGLTRRADVTVGAVSAPGVA